MESDPILREQGYHEFTVNNSVFTIDVKYGYEKVVGSGAYGTVVKCKIDSSKAIDGKNTPEDPSAKEAAIKLVSNAFNDEIDAKRILREIKLLKHLKHHNVIRILDMIPPPPAHICYIDNYRDVYIVADLMETDLHRIIYSKQALTIDHSQYFVYQVLCALKFIHSANVIHRDLKPSNLLVNSDCQLKVCDLGLARGVIPENDEDASKEGGSMLLTEYVVTRWYRAPEIMLACQEYSKAIDIWGVGCIFAELINRKAFFPGDDYIGQLKLICQKLGKLSEDDLSFVSSEKAKKFMRSLPDDAPLPLDKQFPDAPPDALDLLNKMLQINPSKRITVDGALAHPFFDAIRDENDIYNADSYFDYSFEDQRLDRVRLKELIWEEMASFRPSCLPVPSRRKENPASSKSLKFRKWKI